MASAYVLTCCASCSCYIVRLACDSLVCAYGVVDTGQSRSSAAQSYPTQLARHRRRRFLSLFSLWWLYGLLVLSLFPPNNSLHTTQVTSIRPLHMAYPAPPGLVPDVRVGIPSLAAYPHVVGWLFDEDEAANPLTIPVSTRGHSW